MSGRPRLFKATEPSHREVYEATHEQVQENRQGLKKIDFCRKECLNNFILVSSFSVVHMKVLSLAALYCKYGKRCNVSLPIRILFFFGHAAWHAGP